MTKNELITEIQTAFKNIKLEDSVGLWEAQGLDNYASDDEILKLRIKDESNNWDNISYEDLVNAQSSLHFFDAKGMRFCLPKFLIFDILADEIFKEKQLYAPDVLFTLGHNVNDEYHKSRFSLMNKNQIETIIHYLEYKLEELILTNDSDIEFIKSTINDWKQKLN